MQNWIPALMATALLGVLQGAGMARTAETVVNVKLQDPSTGAAVKGMQIGLDKAIVAPGLVLFKVKNNSKSLVHEMILVKTDVPVASWAYDTKKDAADESKLKSLGEVSELAGGRSGTLRIRLATGSYRLFCNQPGHLHGNMWTEFNVQDTPHAMQ